MLNSTNNNQYAALATRDHDNITVTISNCSKTVETANKAANPIHKSKELVIADAGATGHFLQPGTPAKNIRPTSIQLASANLMEASWNQHMNVRLTIQNYLRQQEQHILCPV